MYKILKKRNLNADIFLMEIEHQLLANSAKAGQFLIIIIEEDGERLPLTVFDIDKERGSVSVVVQAIGKSTKKMANLEEGDFLFSVVGPLGNPSEFIFEDIEELKNQRFLFVAGGVGAAPVYPQVKWFSDNGLKCDVVIAARNAELLILVDEFSDIVDKLFVCTDDGTQIADEKGKIRFFKGNAAQYADILLQENHYYHVVAIGPMVMMKYLCLTTAKYAVPTTVSMNPIMVDGTGMCGACRITVAGKVKFACIEGPEFDGHKVDFDEAIRRSSLYKRFEIATVSDEHQCKLADVENVEKAENCEINLKNRFTRIPCRQQKAELRVKNFEEVCYGYNFEEAQSEASRCLNCKTPLCVGKCPVNIDIPAFIEEIKSGDISKAAEIIAKDSVLPAVCGRVCPQEEQCEAVCVLGKRGDAVAIGKLERFVADFTRDEKREVKVKITKNPYSIAIVGSGPAGLSCAADLAKAGCKVTIFEALHKAGGVLVYGIPEFRLPKAIVQNEIDKLVDLGVEIKTNVVIGDTLSIDELFSDKGFDYVFIGSGAGLPKFMNIAGENLNGVFSANEILARSNLMKAYSTESPTPIYVGQKAVVVGGGNVAMDAARTAKRLGADVHLVYRRSKAEMPARNEEIEHAIEEGIILQELTNPLEIIGDEVGWVKAIKCIRMRLGDADASGRRSPIEIPDSEFFIETDVVIMSLGTSPNPLIINTTKGLETSKWKTIVADEDGQTSRKNVFAGGDAVTGAATVILAMEAGRKAAKKILENLNISKE
jgi:glutamate synthase (NADPH/NADH) small chain